MISDLYPSVWIASGIDIMRPYEKFCLRNAHPHE
jgi:hypothetical protein